MREQLSVCAALVLVSSIVLSGCGQKEEAPPVQPTPVVTRPAPPTPTPPAPSVKEQPRTVVDLVASAKGGVEKAMTLAKQGKYQEALALLQQKATEVQANPEAKKLVDDAVVQIKKMMADAASKAATEKATKSLGDLGK